MQYSLEPINGHDIALAKDLLQQMIRIRLLEEKIADLRKSGDIQGSVHLCIGQEAIYMGIPDQRDRSFRSIVTDDSDRT